MVYQVIDLEVAVDKGSFIMWLRLWISEKCYRIVVVWDLAYRMLCLNVDCLSLRRRNGAESFNLAVVEA